ncbi:2-aminomuconate deaminase [Caballeronia glebae]|uniref:2-aminomuconate deaminase n=1 Tax=Caballeronia glebae TaxID=1777143 RepID=A0A158AZN2_9BURK|nr:RidA family protein [Caballeronia glebae]SAK63169.1 2-aminomuconate deaminase [Caballeronia glebae]
MDTSDALPAGGHYNKWRVVGDLMFFAGQVPRDDDRKILGETLEEQTVATIRNVQKVLQSAGCDLKDLVQIRAYLADPSDFSRFNSVYAEVMGEIRPPRTMISCQLNGVLVEIDGVAAKPSV